jgi:hypothetical protein
MEMVFMNVVGYFLRAVPYGWVWICNHHSQLKMGFLVFGHGISSCAMGILMRYGFSGSVNPLIGEPYVNNRQQISSFSTASSIIARIKPYQWSKFPQVCIVISSSSTINVFILQMMIFNRNDSLILGA